MSNDDNSWDCGWNEHERAQRRRLAELPFSEKLRWLEEAHELVRHMRPELARVPKPSPDP